MGFAWSPASTVSCKPGPYCQCQMRVTWSPASTVSCKLGPQSLVAPFPDYKGFHARVREPPALAAMQGLPPAFGAVHGAAPPPQTATLTECSCGSSNLEVPCIESLLPQTWLPAGHQTPGRRCCQDCVSAPKPYRCSPQPSPAGSTVSPARTRQHGRAHTTSMGPCSIHHLHTYSDVCSSEPDDLYITANEGPLGQVGAHDAVVQRDGLHHDHAVPLPQLGAALHIRHHQRQRLVQACTGAILFLLFFGLTFGTGRKGSPFRPAHARLPHLPAALWGD